MLDGPDGAPAVVLVNSLGPDLVNRLLLEHLEPVRAPTAPAPSQAKEMTR